MDFAYIYIPSQCEFKYSLTEAESEGRERRPSTKDPTGTSYVIILAVSGRNQQGILKRFFSWSCYLADID